MSLVCKMSQAAVLDQFIELFLKFQFLIGSLGAIHLEGIGSSRSKFQFLIGSLRAENLPTVSSALLCFNSS